MTYIVLDLEWNQAASAEDPVYEKLPFHLTGEIIQIGAVRVSVQGELLDTLKLEIKPKWFRKMHSAVQKLTGITQKQLAAGISFPKAMEQFCSWCGEDCVFLTWGFDDIRMLKQNLMLYQMDDSWLGRWYNLQMIYNQQTGGGTNQKALSTAAEEMGIPQTRPVHDALNDAYYTACIACKLDLQHGLEGYSQKAVPRKSQSGGQAPFLRREEYSGYHSKQQLLGDKKLRRVCCPKCGEQLFPDPMVAQNGDKYIFLARCPKHGVYFVRIKTDRKREHPPIWRAIRLIFAATPDYEELYRRKAKRAKQRQKRLKKQAGKQPANSSKGAEALCTSTPLSPPGESGNTRQI